jgi:hypothetical protein
MTVTACFSVVPSHGLLFMFCIFADRATLTYQEKYARLVRVSTINGDGVVQPRVQTFKVSPLGFSSSASILFPLCHGYLGFGLDGWLGK